MSVINNRYDFVFFFDVENGNPNGDPDAGNQPRIDSETNLGIITDVCLKRKIRNYVQTALEGTPGYNILVKPGKALNTVFTEAYDAIGLSTGKNNKNWKSDSVERARDYMCQNYFDVRTFGMVMSTGDNPCGIVRGPVQLTFARSISPINPVDIAITRQARTTEERVETGQTEIGTKSIVPYGLYRAEGYISASLAQKITKLSEEDVEVLWKAIINMFEDDHSAARGKMSMRKVYIFKHDSLLGNVPSQTLFDKISAKLINENKPPRDFADYKFTVDRQMPSGVELIEKL